MFRRSLTFALRSFAPTFAARTFRSLPLRFAPSFSNFNDNDFDEGREGSFDSNSKGGPSGFQRSRPSYPRVHQQAEFEGLSSLTGHKMVEFIGERKQDKSTNEFVGGILEGLKTREGNFAWQQLPPERRQIFLKNFLLMVEEANESRGIFSTSQHLRSMLRLLLSTNDYKMIEELILSLFSYQRSPAVRYTLASVALAGLLDSGKINNYNMATLKPVMAAIEQNILQQFIEPTFRQDNRQNDILTTGATNLFRAVQEGFRAQPEGLEKVIRTLVDIPMNEVQPHHLILAFAALGRITRGETKVTFNNPTNVQFINYCLEKNLGIQNKSGAKGQGQDAAAGGEERAWVSPVEVGKPVNSEQLFGFVQALLIECEQEIQRLPSLLALIANRLPRGAFLGPFRRWFSRYLSNYDFESSPRGLTKNLMRAASTIIGMSRHSRTKTRLLDFLSKRFPEFQDPVFLSDILPIFNGFRAVLAPERPADETTAPTTLFEADLSAADRALIKECFQKVSDFLLSDDISLPLSAAFPVVRTFVGSIGNLTLDQLKTKRLHREMWQKVLKRQFLGQDNFNNIFSTLALFDLEKDAEMQKVLMESLQKNEFKPREPREGQEAQPRDDAKPFEPKFTGSMDQIYTRFHDNKGNLVGESLAIYEQLGNLRRDSRYEERSKASEKSRNDRDAAREQTQKAKGQ